MKNRKRRRLLKQCLSVCVLLGLLLCACGKTEGPQSVPGSEPLQTGQPVSGDGQETESASQKEETTSGTESSQTIPESKEDEEVPENREPKKIDLSGETKKVYYYHDPGAIYLPSPYNPSGEKIVTEERCRAAVDEAAEGGADVYISEIYGMVPWYPSKVYSAEEHLEWFLETFHKSGDNAYSSFTQSGGDFIKTMCAQAHEKGLAYWLDYRINDVHGITYDTFNASNAYSLTLSRFLAEHLDERLGTSQIGFNAYKYGLDFRYEDVREYKLSMIRELIENYDIDGFMVDFLRAPVMYSLTETTMEERKELTLDFLKSIRKMLDEKSAETGDEYYFGVKVPMDLDSYGRLGIDVAAFEKEAGVNVFFVFSYYTTRQDYRALDMIRENTENSLLVFDMSDTVTRPNDLPKVSLRATTKEEFYTTAHLAYRHGADGVGLFNMPWYREAAEFVFAKEPPFEIMHDLKDPEFLASQPQHYFEMEEDNLLIHDFHLATAVWSPNVSHSFDMEMAPPDGGWTKDGVLRLESLDEIAGLDFEVQINGTVLKPAEVTGEPYKNPYLNLLGKPSMWLGYTVPKECLVEGTNEVTVINHSDQSVKFYFIDLAIE